MWLVSVCNQQIHYMFDRSNYIIVLTTTYGMNGKWLTNLLLRDTKMIRDDDDDDDGEEEDEIEEIKNRQDQTQFNHACAFEIPQFTG